MSINSVRAQVAAQIRADNPTWTIRDHAASAPDSLGRGRVFASVSRTTLVPHADAFALTHNLRIEVMVPSTSASAEDDCDAALDKALLSLERINGLRWTNAERAVFDGKFFGYQITASADSKNVYREQVLAEAEAANEPDNE